MAMYGFFTAMGKTKRTLKDAPKESRLLRYMIGLLYRGAFLSPIWRGGALLRCVDFSKIYIVWLLVFLLITTFDRLRKIIFIQVFSVVIVCVAAIVVGALFAPEAYQFFPYFAVAFTATLLQTINEQEQRPGTAPPPPKKPRHFRAVYPDHGTSGAVSLVR